MAFYEYRQNNSGGHFIVNEAVAHIVIIEADTANQADAKAEDIGLYFDGDNDCPTCGERWSSAQYQKGDKVPSHYGEPITKCKCTYMWPDATGYVYFKNGEKKTYTATTKGFKRVYEAK